MSKCVVTLYATVGGRRVVIGTGTVVLSGTTTSSIVVDVVLNTLGRALVTQPGGVAVLATAAITPVGSTTLVTVSDHVRVVAQNFLLPRPVFFDTGSSTISAADKRYLNALRTKLGAVHVRSISCVGFTDSVDTSASNLRLGQARADRVCAYLVRGTGITIASSTRGESAPHASNATTDGRTRNRRTEIHLHY
jgi:outer membrane protein OmpA-like peptidoglycan-associated protein